MNGIQETLFQTIDTITESRINKLKFDKTIEAIVISDAKSDVGEYELKYQDLIFVAYSSSGTTKFKVDENVLVLVPEGDMGKRKTIISSNKKEGEHYVDFDKIIDRIGINFVDEAEDFEVGLSTTFDETVGFKLKKQSMVDQYPGQKYLVIGADLYTNINEDDLDGRYGIAIDCVFLNSEGKRIPHTFEFTNLNVTGNPYQARGYKETLIPLLEERLVDIVSARTFSEGFTAGNENIIVRKLTVEYADIREQDKSEYSGNIIYPRGTNFRSGVLYPDEKLQLIMEFKQGGQILDTEAIAYKWFVMNSEVVDTDDIKYHPDAGLGWEWIQSNSYDEALIKGAGTKTLEVSAPFVPTFSVFKCIATYVDKSAMVSDMVTLIDHTEAVDVEIVSSNGVSFVNGAGSTTLTCNITQSGEPLDLELDYEWAQIKEDETVTLLQKGPNNEYDLLASTIGLKSTYTCEISIKGQARPIATGRITLVSIKDGSTQGAVIVGGFRTVLYDADGSAPEDISREGFQFDVYENGEKVTSGLDWTWSIPADDKTLLTLENATIINGIQTTKNRILNLGIKKKFDISQSNNTVTLQVVYTKNGIATTLMDHASIAITKVGNNGADGAGGKPGVDGNTYVYEIQGGSPTIFYDGGGENPSPSITNQFELMFAKNGDIGLAPQVDRVEWEIPPRTESMISFNGKDPAVRRFTTTKTDGVSNPHIFSIIPDSVWSESKFNNYISAKITYEGMIFREVYPISVVKNGASGFTINTLPSAYAFNANENGIVLDNRSLEIKFDVKDGNGIESSFVIDSYTTPSGTEIVRNQFGDGVIFSIINDSAMANEGTVDFVIKVNSKRYFQTFSYSRVTDGSSPYSVTLISSNGLTFKRGDIHTVITAFVMKGVTQVDPLTIQDSFLWIKKTKTGEIDVEWEPEFVDGQKHSINITPDDILERATFECKLQI